MSKQGLVSIANGTARDVDLLVGTNADEWHLPLVLMGHQPAVILIATFATQFMYSWLANHARGSVLIVMIAHAAQGASGDYFGPLFSGASATLETWLLVAVQVVSR